MLSRIIARFPTLVASGIYTIAAALAFFPLWTGKVLLPEMSDQNNGYSFRSFAAQYIERFGEVPGWYPYLFGGMPFAANTAHGDTFFPTALLRLALPVDIGMALGFLIFTLLAGIFAFLFLRGVGLTWGSSFVGGAAYMFTGQVISMASPGHDGKLFVSALLPLALLFLFRATASRDWRHYLYFGVTVGFSLLTPHFQMTYYLLMAAGFFWLFLVFFSDQKENAQPWWRSALLFGGSLAIGFGIAAIQLVPFFEYLPFSPRGAAGSSSTGYEYATGWSMPPEELLNTVWPAFSGMLFDYWGRNQFKLHSEYVGAAVALLALLSFRLRSHRRLAWFFVFLAIYATIFAFGGYTPFYRIPYTILPYLKSTRAVSMIFTLTAFSIAVLAAFGTEWLLARAPVLKGKRVETLSERGFLGLPRPIVIGIGVLAAFALLSAVGAMRPLMTVFAEIAGRTFGPTKVANVDRSYPGLVMDAFRVLLFGIAVAAMALPSTRRRWTPEAWALILALIVVVELYTVERRYLRFSDRAAVSFAPDDVVRALQADSSIFRVLPYHDDYTGENYLMVHGIRSTFGYNGQELHRYDELLGGKNSWGQPSWPILGNANMWRILGAKYLILGQPVEAPTLTQVGGELRTHRGGSAYLYRIAEPTPYAFLVGEALRLREGGEAAERQLVATVLDPRFDPRRILLLPSGAPVGVDSLTQAQVPEPIGITVAVHEDRPGRLRLELASPSPDSAFVFVAENWYKNWEATVDGRAAPVVRAQGSLIAVPIPQGARNVTLDFVARDVGFGATISGIVALTVIGLAVGSAIVARRSRTAVAPVPTPASTSILPVGDKYPAPRHQGQKEPRGEKQPR
jgi:hypothetical protein